MIQRFFFCLMVCSFAIAGNAQDTLDWDFATPAKQGCSSGNMMQMNDCLATAYADTDSLLNALYKKLQKGLLKPTPLRKAQAAWLRFRDLHCEFHVPANSEGSGTPYSRNSCLIDLTEKRILDLKRIIPCNGCVEFKPEYYEIR
jgi:uncharacterized protein YecT (DUF1311 family)